MWIPIVFEYFVQFFALRKVKVPDYSDGKMRARRFVAWKFRVLQGRFVTGVKVFFLLLFSLGVNPLSLMNNLYCSAWHFAVITP